MTDLRFTVTNTSPDGGTFLTPFWFGLHDGSFDLFESGEAASAGLEALAEDGTFDTIGQELTDADADGQGFVVTGAGGPIATGETGFVVVDVDGSSNPYASFGAMLLPSNDAFVGNNQALELFDENGEFVGAQTVSFSGDRVYDAGTEVNTEMDAAFINQTAPDTGIDENGVVTLHPGFIDSLGNPGGTPIILGGTNAFGAFIDPVAADFTQPAAQIATVHINTVAEVDLGTNGRFYIGGSDDDLVEGNDARNFILGRRGWDVIDGEGGRDVIKGGRGNDVIDGGAGRDLIYAGRDSDQVTGGTGRDLVNLGRDTVADTFIYATGDGNDTVRNFGEADLLLLSVDGIATAEDALDVAEQEGRNVRFDFDEGSILLRNASLSDIDESNILIA
ncbi:MAG: spondin domain-containing protein [Pseudomonadota bacterium]